RTGGDSHEVRIHERSRAAGCEQPARADQAERRRLAETIESGDDRSFLSAPSRSECANRRRRRNGEGADSTRQGEALRTFGSGSENDPPRTRRPAGHRTAERIFIVVATP